MKIETNRFFNFRYYTNFILEVLEFDKRVEEVLLCYQGLNINLSTAIYHGQTNYKAKPVF